MNIAEFSAANLRELANDVTVSGEEEPAAYVQEIFEGDGTTTKFELSEAVFRGTNRTLLKDSFQEPAFDTSQWNVGTTGNHLTLTSAGLTMNGGNGFDGQTTVSGLNAVEMGGFVLAELGGVQLGAACDGVLAGFYSGQPLLPNCFAGFRVRQTTSTTGGVTVVVPVVNGAEVGSVFTPVAGHRYTLRVRLYCAEMLRVPQVYYCMVDGVVQEFGNASAVSAAMQMVFEVVDEGASSNTPATVLYDTAAAGAPVATTPGTCLFCAVNAVEMYGSIASVAVTRPGSAWVVSTLPNGSQMTRLIGTAGQGVDCEMTYGTAAGKSGQGDVLCGACAGAGRTCHGELSNAGSCGGADCGCGEHRGGDGGGCWSGCAGRESMAGQGDATGGAVERGLRERGAGGAGDGDGAVGGAGGDVCDCESRAGHLAGRCAGGDECGCDDDAAGAERCCRGRPCSAGVVAVQGVVCE